MLKPILVIAVACRLATTLTAASPGPKVGV